jgi:ribosomal protein S18 acetylase RimI-like enzyme
MRHRSLRRATRESPIREVIMPNGEPVRPSPISTNWVPRQAAASDATAAAGLIHMAWGDFAQYMFCQPDAPHVRALLARLFARRGHRLSYRYATIAEDGAGPQALLIMIPGSELLRLTWGLLAAMTADVGLAGGLRFGARWLPFLMRPEAARGELYIDTLSVADAWRGRGVGSALLAMAEGRACAMGLRACSLSVDLTNPDAQRLYERRGYRVEHTFRPSRYARSTNYPGFHHMVKPLIGRKL